MAAEVLTGFAGVDYFRSFRLCRALAERDPGRCVDWTVTLVAHRMTDATLPDVVAETLTLIASLIECPDRNSLPLLDELAERCWCAGSFDDRYPYLQRMVARLAWATTGFVCIATSSSFDSKRVAIPADPSDDSAMETLAHQCGSALDMTYNDTADGRLLVATAFTREMEALS